MTMSPDQGGQPALTDLAYRVREPAGEPEGALVLLHGRATDEHDLQPLLDGLDPERRLLGVTPRAPLSLPPGGAHWYVVPRVGYPDPETFGASYATLSGWLDALAEQTGIPVDFARAARSTLEAAGAHPLYQEYPLPHTIDPAFLRTLTPWLRDALG